MKQPSILRLPLRREGETFPPEWKYIFLLRTPIGTTQVVPFQIHEQGFFDSFQPLRYTPGDSFAAGRANGHCRSRQARSA
jgi:hypothetical protein